MPTAFAPLSPAERDTISVSGPREGGTVARQGGDEGGIAAPRFPMWRGAMHDQVESAAVIGGDVGRVGACRDKWETSGRQIWETSVKSCGQALRASRAYWETSGRQMGDKPEIMRPEH